MAKNKMTTKEAQERIVKNMRNWQKIERAAVTQTAQIEEKSKNPVIQLVMEIIQRDSRMHYRVQELIADSLESKTMTLTPEDVAKVWGLIEQHIELERKTVALAKQSIEATAGRKGLIIQRYLLEYLLTDEEKHDKLLDNLEAIKKDMYPYA